MPGCLLGVSAQQKPMSIRVNSNEVALTSRTGQTEQLKPTGANGAASTSAGKGAEDRIEVSSTTENIHSAISAQNAQHAERLKQIGSLVADGRYFISSQDLSHALVSGAIRGSTGSIPGTK